MKIAITTDTHYGFDHRTHKIHEKFLGSLKDVCIEHHVKLLVHSGDWIADNQHQLPRTWKMFRKYLGDLPILSVTGNHDYWDRDYWGSPIRKRSYCRHPSGMSLNEMFLQHKEWSLENNIHLLTENPYTTSDFVFFGFNGWYGHSNPPTNDSKYMNPQFESAPTSLYLSNLAYRQLDRILVDVSNYQDKKKVCVTHFPPYSKDSKYEIYCANTSFLDPIAENFNLLIVGHSHQSEDWNYNSLRVVNAGTNFDPISGGYNKPKFVIIDI